MTTHDGLAPTNHPQATLRPGKHPENDPVHPGHGYQRSVIGDGIVFERDVPVQLRDGTTIYVDLFRPDDDQRHPTILGWAPFGKHPHVDWERDFPGADIPRGISRWAAFEAADPLQWVPWGYVVVSADPRGIGYSEGIAEFMTEQEGEDEYDLIEWLGTRPWSNGKVGTIGVSYLSMSTYRVAALKPPHLAAVVLWEALNDFYRDVKFHGGIPAFNMCRGWMAMTSWSTTAVEDLEAGMREHPLYDDFWQRRVADLERIEVPAFLVSSWANHGVHTRGTMEAWGRISSTRKWLDLNGKKEWSYFYQPESVRRQKAFLDHFLKGEGTELEQWPPVRLEVRESLKSSYHRGENEYPLARTQWTRYHLAPDSTLRTEAEPEAATIAYDARTGSAAFDLTFDARTEIVGPASLRLWISLDGHDDADVFVGLKKFDPDGQEVNFEYIGFSDDGIVALGWLRLSHRALDEARSTPATPRPLHTREEFVYDDKPVQMDIPILDSGTVFEPGSRLRLVVQGHDIIRGVGMFPQHAETRNFGRHLIHTGGEFDSSLLLPVIPGEKA